MPTLRNLVLLLSLFGPLTACSPHPSSGEWESATAQPDNYSRLKVEFDGKAYLFVPEREEHLVRCFWAGESRQIINLNCILNDPSEKRFNYQLRVQGDHSDLLEKGAVLTRFRRK